ncbi:alkaline phosphatase family protein [Actinoallomurus purpureus]|uniref:alkaline phosphatase D family protein n=1 Tax=Actinoallomurus purpureus TaxID=478114 RepID=UPI0020926265|nr:alkaline phosphatase D family protein [Actinoallomurus purpureus]MCO6010149.1 alkaline phosphatase family protein [Actinoallomurus purpureus]
MTRLILGPLLRHVGARTATVWVETDQPCEVRVLDAVSRTFTVHGHHYALVDVDGLEPGSDTPYDVLLDGERVWPEPGAPPGPIRTRTPGGARRFAVGSCRVAPASEATHGVDALAVCARRLLAGDDPPDELLLIGDQVYADETTPEVREFITARRDIDAPPYAEIADFEEYAHLYRLAWGTDPAVRWLLATVPSSMVFDDHDIRDDWNTSEAWRREMRAHPWWERRITAGLGAYWIYQHLGNLSPVERAADPVYQAVLAAVGDAGKVVDEFAERADREPGGFRWSYVHGHGRTRIVVLDSRCGRVLEEGRRAMLDDAELAWFGEQCRADVDHLIVATSLPFLLPGAIHHMEAWNEAVAGGAWGRRAAGFGERLRQTLDLEHWAAFDASFRAVADILLEVANGPRPPASITLLSGDVHYSYLARVRGTRTPISQVVCSPLRNPLTGPFKRANQVACRDVGGLPARAVARLAGVRRPPLRWRVTDGPWFDNALATVHVDGRTASVRWEAADAEDRFRELGRAPLS